MFRVVKHIHTNINETCRVENSSMWGKHTVSNNLYVLIRPSLGGVFKKCTGFFPIHHPPLQKYSPRISKPESIVNVSVINFIWLDNSIIWIVCTNSDLQRWLGVILLEKIINSSSRSSFAIPDPVCYLIEVVSTICKYENMCDSKLRNSEAPRLSVVQSSSDPKQNVSFS
jgi:hypothetical protein